MRTVLHRLSLFITTIALIASESTAQATPDALTYAGRLLDADMGPLDGPFDVSLRIFDSLAGGEPVFEQAYPATAVSDGYFELIIDDNALPDGAALPAVFADHDALFWEVEVDGDILAPRQRITAVPWALSGATPLPFPLACPLGHALVGIDAGGAPGCQAVLMSLPDGLGCDAGFVLAAIDPTGAPQCVPVPSGLEAANWTAAHGWGDHSAAGYLTSEADPTIALLNAGGWCVSDGLTISCDAAPPVLAETDPKVGTLSEGQWCTTDGSTVHCATPAPVLVETDPKVGTLSEGQWCTTDGSTVHCATPAPVLVETDPSVNALGRTDLNCQTGEHPTLVRRGPADVWECVHGATVDVTHFGANPHDTADDRVAILHAGCHALANRIGTIIFPAGTYHIASSGSLFPPLHNLGVCEILYGITVPADIPRPNLHFLGLGDVRIVYTGTAPQHILFDLWEHPQGFADVRFTNLTLDGNDLVATGITVRGAATEHPGSFFIVEKCRFLNFRQNEGISTAAAGIAAASPYETIAVRDSFVERVTRTNPSSFSTGIGFSNVIGTVTIANNVIREILTPNDADADGVKVFGRLRADGTRRGKATVRDNYFENCEGRAVKFQVEEGTAENNTVEQSAGKTILNYHAFDAQVGSGRLSHNRVFIRAGVALGSSAMPFLVQVEGGSNPQKPETPRFAIVEHNDLYTEQRVAYFTGVAHPHEAPAIVHLRHNTAARLPGSPTSEAAIATFVQYRVTNADLGYHHLTLRVEDNTVWSNGQLVRFRNDTGEEFADMRHSLTLIVDGNRNNHRGAASPPEIPRPTLVGSLFMNPATFRIEDLTVRNNDGFASPTWYGYLDAKLLGEGSTVIYGTSGVSGGLIDGHPTRSSWLVIERQGRLIRSQDLTGVDVHQVGVRVEPSGSTLRRDWVRLD